MPSVEYTGDPGRRAKGLDPAATKRRRGATKPLPRTTSASRCRSGSLFEESSDQPQQLGRFERLRDEPIGAERGGVARDIERPGALDPGHRENFHVRPLASQPPDRLPPAL